MSDRITPISWNRFEKFLRHVGCRFVSQEGSHRKWRREGLKRPIILPRRQLTVGVIKSNLKTLGISHEEYLEIMGRL